MPTMLNHYQIQDNGQIQAKKRFNLLPTKQCQGGQKKNRRKAVDEHVYKNKLSGGGYMVQCSRCQNLGHNSRNCKLPKVHSSSSSSTSIGERPPIPTEHVGSRIELTASSAPTSSSQTTVTGGRSS